MRFLSSALLTLEHAMKAAVRHRSFDGWWRYRFELRQIWRSTPTLRWREEE